MAQELLIRCSILAADPQPDESIVKEVLSYFLRNVEAADSLEGIARWRLLDEVVRRRVDETYRALTWLVEHEYVRETMAAGTESIFSLNLHRLVEAKAFLAGEDRSEGQEEK
jgi:hypothetical protein